MRLFFHKDSGIFNLLVPTLSRTLLTNVAKFCASTSEHIKKTLFQFIVVCKIASTYCIADRAKQVGVRGFQNCAVSRTGKNALSKFCDCLKCAQAVMRPAFVVSEKYSSMFRLRRTLRMRCRSLFKVPFYGSWRAPKSRQGILQHWYTASYSTLTACLKWQKLYGNIDS
jgi:hypothetical protein